MAPQTPEDVTLRARTIRLVTCDVDGVLTDSRIYMDDHGQEFNDSGRNYWGHNSNFTRYQTGVPLILYSPTLPPGVHRHRTTHFDIVPTLLRDQFGCAEPFETYSVGRSLFEAGGRDALVLSEYTDFAIVTEGKIAVVREQGMEVFDASHAVIPDRRLEPELIAQALEQQSRFYRRVRLSSN